MNCLQSRLLQPMIFETGHLWLLIFGS